MEQAIADILQENKRRNDRIHATFNPVTGEGSTGERKRVRIEDFPYPEMWLPVLMLEEPVIKLLVKYGSIRETLRRIGEENPSPEDVDAVVDEFTRIRIKYDFPFWAAVFVYIKNKGGGEDVLFNLTRPQRKFVERLEAARLADKPIRIVLLKARQWGGSTTSQIYMAWLQLVHKIGLNSLIVAQVVAGSDEILDMFDRMIRSYDTSLLYEVGTAYGSNTAKWIGVGRSGTIHRVPQRNCKVKVGTAEKPDSCRGGDYSLVHLSEVGLWKATENKKPEDIVRSACSGVLYQPYTMIVYESTANGTGNFFQTEYDDAKKGISQFEPLFISWFDIDIYSLPFSRNKEKWEFARKLWDGRHGEHVKTKREEPGNYLWYLWELGATLEAIHWYVEERSKYTDHGLMASEYPSDDVEAFVHSGSRVFDDNKVVELKATCKPPKVIGEMTASGPEGFEALENLHFVEDSQGGLWVWDYPEVFPEEECRNRYLVVVDIGGRSRKADWSVITVFDRYWMIEGGKPMVVAQWYGHCDMDILAWKSAQIAHYYNEALLVIESNTLETHDKERNVDGDHSGYILNQIVEFYPNLYERARSDDEIAAGAPKKYGFHTNVATKPKIIDTLIKVVREGLYVERDERCLDEYRTYERKQNGAYGAVQGKHDDLLMTRAIGLHICFKEMEPCKMVPKNLSMHSLRKKTISAATI